MLSTNRDGPDCRGNMASFPPSFSSFPDLYPPPEPGPSSTKHEHKTKSRKHRRAKEDQNDKQQNVTKLELSRFFYSDRKGDLLNIQYGGLYAGDIPKYRTVGGGRNVLGLPNSYVVQRRAGKGIEVGPSSYRKLSNLTDPASRALLSQPPSRRLLPSKDSSRYAEIDGFIRIPSRRGMNEDIDSYRSLSKMEVDNNSDSSPSESDNDSYDSDDNDTLVLSAHQESLKLLEQDLEANPRAVSKWLALLNQTLSTVPFTSKNATEARSEITVSIIARALSADPRNNLDRHLRLTYLRAGEDIWHESKLKAEWEDALKVGGVDIHLEWLEWKIRSGNKGVDGVLESAARALTGLDIGEEADIGKVRIFWRVAVALKNAGYPERAMAMFQAQAELTFNPPPNIAKMSFNTQLVDLEEFWDSECPRLGEEGAEGWASWYSTRKDVLPFSEEPLLPNIPDLDPYRQWASEELQADLKLYLPTRAALDTPDPYSTVLLSDIRPMLLNIQCQQAKHGFRMAWLSFLGLHIPGFSLSSDDNGDWDDRWNAGYLTSPNYLQSLFPSETTQRNLLSDSVAGVIVGRERAYSTPFGPVRYWGCDVSRPLDLSSGEPGRLPRRALWTSDDIADVDANIVRRLFTSLRFNKDDPEWDVLTLTFEMAFNPKSALKLSKAFLSVHRDSLEHWNAHVQLERLRGRLDEARKIYQTILIVSRMGNTRPGESQMWWNWAEMEWLDGRDEQALDVILSSVGMESPATGITILRTKRSLEAMITSTKLSPQWKEYEAWIKLRALLELLTSQDPTAALAILDESSEKGSCAVESLTTAALILLYFHSVILKRPTPPSILRERAETAVEIYPSNSIVLGIFLEAERGQGIWGRVRTTLGGNAGRTKDVARRAEEVWVAAWQQGRWQSEVERTRNGLATAVEHERTRGSFVIWRLYIEFEIRVKELLRAKKLLFRAIGECPLVKELYLLAFGPLRSVFQVHELNALAETMAERGIRLRRGLEDVIESVVEADGEEDDESEDEIEHNARELRRLLPY